MSPALTVVPYRVDRHAAWDAFVASAKNGHFLFQRGYMDYHAHRFTDASLMAYAGKKLVGVLPANLEGSRVASHGGLTFGGLVMGRETGVVEVQAILRQAANAWKERGATSLLYKAIPWIYATMPAEEDLYALHRMGARLVRRDYSTTANLSGPTPLNQRQLAFITKARAMGALVAESHDFTEFHALLTATLRERHDAKPVHSVDELRLLHARFPENIRLFEVRQHGRLVSGMVVYETAQVVHSQYTANGPEGRAMRALDFLNAHLLELYRGKVPFFDFGTSNTADGGINEGLVAFKEGWGGRGVVHDFYELAL